MRAFRLGFHLGWSLAATASLLVAGVLIAEGNKDASADASEERNKRLEKLIQKDAEDYQFTLEGDETPLKFESKPVFQWTNAARLGQPRVQHGLVYVWTKNGRAEVVGTLFAVTRQPTQSNFLHEFHSLATSTFEGRYHNSAFWSPEKAGIAPAIVPDAPAPAENERQRLAQMKTIARRFSGYSINFDDKRWDLSLLATPLYRMPEASGDVLDQAVFTMVSTAGTDPEALLVIEARQVDGKPQWHYSICRFTDLKTWISLDDQLVWSFERGTAATDVDADFRQIYRITFSAVQTIP